MYWVDTGRYLCRHFLNSLNSVNMLLFPHMLENGENSLLFLKHLFLFVFLFEFLCEASLTGKDDSAAKSKRGRKVQFNNGG